MSAPIHTVSGWNSPMVECSFRDSPTPSSHRYLADKETAAQVRSTFAGFYPLDQVCNVQDDLLLLILLLLVMFIKGPEGDKTVQMALNNPHKFVLKSQREAGGMCM